jgi:MoxR-like ATPase
MSTVLRHLPEHEFAHELRALAQADTRPRPEGWLLSPHAVIAYLTGEGDGPALTPKFFAPRRLLEAAVATLATDRALLLLGVPGTGKSTLSEHLAAAICGDSTYLVQGTAGTGEDALRYGWNYARLLAEGPGEPALVPSPVLRAMREGRLARVEELTRVPAEVQDSLITILSEKALPIPELATQARAVRGFNLIATANNRDRGVNELSSALRRRFNTVVLPLPETLEEELTIVLHRVAPDTGLPAPAPEEVRRLVTIFRELRSGRTEDGRAKLRQPTGTLGTGEIISTLNHSLTLAGHFGQGTLGPAELASGLTGAIIKDPDRDPPVWRDYLETVALRRPGWKPLAEHCLEAI